MASRIVNSVIHDALSKKANKRDLLYIGRSEEGYSRDQSKETERYVRYGEDKYL